jgi:biotin carboxyl carrier protein
MKMKNAIRATRAGVIAAIHIHVGDTVVHSQALMDFAD